MEKDTYLTIGSSCSGNLKVLGSRFTGNAEPIIDKESAEEFITNISKKYHDATHNCYAYKLITEREETVRTSDDREPQGTAGKPILTVIEKQNLYNVIVLVTRYFGGKKLGKGGLMRAYRECAEVTLSHARIIKKTIYEKIYLEFPYNETGSVMKIISEFDGKVSSQVYEDKCSLSVEIRRDYLDKFKDKIFDISSRRSILMKF